MLQAPHYVTTDRAEVERLIDENPWATLVSHTASGLIASHYPFLLEHGGDDITVVSHLGRPDDELHELGAHEVIVIVQGPHGYISPAWYDAGQFIPTWNHVTAHLYGTPERLDADENFRVLGALVDRFEAKMPNPTRLSHHEGYARRVAEGTVGIRIRVARFEARLKLSQDKSPAAIERITAALRDGEHHCNPRLSDEMARVNRLTR